MVPSPLGMESEPKNSQQSSTSEMIYGRPEYQVPHYAAPDFSLKALNGTGIQPFLFVASD